MFFDFTIALSYLHIKGPEKVIALFSLIGIVLGVAVLIITTAVMNGFRLELIKSITGVDGHINVYNYMNNYQATISTLQKDEDIQKVIPMIINQVMLSSQHNNMGAFMRGVEADDLKESIIAQKIIAGDLNDFSNGIVIGARLAAALMLKVGDTINIFSTQTVSTFMGKIPRMKSYKVIAIFEVGMFEYDNMIAYMPINLARTFFSYTEDSINSIDIYVHDASKADIIAKKIEKTLGITTNNWKERGGYLEALETERTVMFLILTMIILIASFNIISSLIMLVQNKKYSIAILRTIGATRASIMRIFIICGSMIGIIGTFIGLALGMAFTYNIDAIKTFLEKLSGSNLFNPVIYFFSKIPAVIVTSDVIEIIVMSLSLSFLATIIPAIRAARQDPARILRGE